MRILVVAPFLPHAGAAHGGGAYLHAFLEALASRADVALVSLARPTELADIRELPERLERVDVFCLPQLADCRGLGRWLHSARNLWRSGVGRRPLVAAKHASRPFARLLGRVAGQFLPDACLVEFATMAQYLPALEGWPRVLTDHEAGGPVPMNHGAVTSDKSRDRLASRDARLWAGYVARFYPLADRLQVLNAEDGVGLAARLGIDPASIGIRPAVVRLPPGDAVARPGTAPPRALFLGDYSHHPNPEAAVRLARSIWPMVRERVADAELWLAGRGARPELVAEFDARPGVSWRGFVPDLPGLLGSVRCLVAPMWSGAGSRIKVLTALAHGLPVVSNELGARGIGSDLVAPGLRLAESDSDLAAAVVETFADAEIGGEQARRYAQDRSMSPARVADLQISSLAEWLDTTRQQC